LDDFRTDAPCCQTGRMNHNRRGEQQMAGILLQKVGKRKR
jgi:hypothetical protein